MSALPLRMVWRHRGIKRSVRPAVALPNIPTITRLPHLIKDLVYYSICNRTAIESDATHYFQRPFCSGLLYGQLTMVWPARPSPDHAHSPPARFSRARCKGHTWHWRPQLSNLRLYIPVKRAKPLRGVLPQRWRGKEGAPGVLQKESEARPLRDTTIPNVAIPGECEVGRVGLGHHLGCISTSTSSSAVCSFR